MSLSTYILFFMDTGIVHNEGSTVDANDEDRDLLADLLRQWHEMLSGGMTTEDLLAFLADLRAALNNPNNDMGALLEEFGITEEMLDELEAGLTGEGEFDADLWFSLFDSMSDMLGTGEFGSVDMIKVAFGDFAIAMIAAELDATSTETQEAIDEILALIDTLIENGVDVSQLSQGLIDLLLAAGMTAEDTSNEKLQQILNGADPADFDFSQEELSAIRDEIEIFGLELADSMSADLLLDLQMINDLRVQIAQAASAIAEALFEAQKAANSNPL